MIPRAKKQEAIERTLDDFGLREFTNRRLERMSMGQRQRVRLAMTFLHRPRVVLLDEPLNSLDEDGSERVAAALAETTARGGAAVWCSPGSDNPTLTFDARYRLHEGRLDLE